MSAVKRELDRGTAAVREKPVTPWIYPTRGHLVVRPEKIEEKTRPSGVILPGQRQRDEPRYGEVVAIGPMKPLEGHIEASIWVSAWDVLDRLPMGIARSPVAPRQQAWLVVGDRVAFNAYSGVPVEHEGEEYLLMSDVDVLAVMPA